MKTTRIPIFLMVTIHSNLALDQGKDFDIHIAPDKSVTGTYQQWISIDGVKQNVGDAVPIPSSGTLSNQCDDALTPIFQANF